MKTLQVTVSDQVAHELKNAVDAGLFEDTDEVVRTALQEFVIRRRFELMEKQQLQDIAWAIDQKTASQ